MDKYLHFRYIKKNKNLHIIFDRDLTFREYKTTGFVTIAGQRCIEF